MVQLKITFAETWLQRVTRRIIFLVLNAPNRIDSYHLPLAFW